MSFFLFLATRRGSRDAAATCQDEGYNIFMNFISYFSAFRIFYQFFCFTFEHKYAEANDAITAKVQALEKELQKACEEKEEMKTSHQTEMKVGRSECV